jgi:large subunit ribosomal protein L18
MIVQIADAKQKGDKILVQANSKELTKYGWNYGTKNLPAAYLVGLLIAKKAQNQKFKKVITDFGLHPPNPESRLFATVKGAIDGGLVVNCPEDHFPKETRLQGQHIAEFAQSLKKSKKENMKNQFASTVKKGFNPENIPTNFEDSKAKINNAKVK